MIIKKEEVNEDLLCVNKCHFFHPTHNSYCMCYLMNLDTIIIQHEQHSTLRSIKCDYCVRDGIKHQINKKCDEIEDFYNTFVYEMDLMFNELKKLKEGLK